MPADDQDAFEMELDREMQKLDELVGMADLKARIRELAGYLRTQEERRRQWLTSEPITLHMIITGPPGTGKTTVARIIAKILHAIGLLKTTAFVEADRSALVGGYIGQSEIKTTALVDKALDGCLFVDEAYALFNESPLDFGHEVVAVLIKRMEDDRNRLAVIFAGYEKPMKTFEKMNPGLSSRIPWRFHIPDYSPAELCQIFERMTYKAGYELEPEAKARVALIVHAAWAGRDYEFSNGRFVRELLTRTTIRHGSRCRGSTDNAEIRTVREQDVPVDEYCRDFHVGTVDLAKLRWTRTCPNCGRSIESSLRRIDALQKCQCGKSLTLYWWSIDPTSAGESFSTLLRKAGFSPEQQDTEPPSRLPPLNEPVVPPTVKVPDDPPQVPTPRLPKRKKVEPIPNDDFISSEATSSQSPTRRDEEEQNIGGRLARVDSNFKPAPTNCEPLALGSVDPSPANPSNASDDATASSTRHTTRASVLVQEIYRRLSFRRTTSTSSSPSASADIETATAQPEVFAPTFPARPLGLPPGATTSPPSGGGPVRPVTYYLPTNATPPELPRPNLAIVVAIVLVAIVLMVFASGIVPVDLPDTQVGPSCIALAAFNVLGVLLSAVWRALVHA